VLITFFGFFWFSANSVSNLAALTEPFTIMETVPSRSCLTTFVCLFFCLISYAATPPKDTPKATHPDLSEDLVKERLKSIEHKLVESKYNAAVAANIHKYVVRYKKGAERILGRTALYFPIFEDYIKKHNMPEGLKYLPIIESSLNPHAVSRRGAGGLWQFMPATAREVGLKINAQVDERCDPHKSTEAALLYLAQQHERFGNWALALAAYNSGSGTVTRAVKRARNSDFWKMQRYLPSETRNYVPAYIAAAYMAEFFEEHEIIPNYPDVDLQVTETALVYDAYTFEEIVKQTGVDLDVVKLLNPAYRKGIIPADDKGNYIILPRRVMAAFSAYVAEHRPDSGDGALKTSVLPIFVLQSSGSLHREMLQTTHVVETGETLEGLSKEFNCSIRQLKTWNNLKSSDLTAGQKLVVFRRPSPARPAIKMEKMEPVIIIPVVIPSEITTAPSFKAQKVASREEYAFYTVSRKERLSDIARKLPGVTTPDLMQLNDFDDDVLCKPGNRIKIKKLVPKK